MNEHSSRSHAIVILEVMGKALEPATRSCKGKLHIVDLAGSERLASGCAMEDPITLAETQAINLSLTALGAY